MDILNYRTRDGKMSEVAIMFGRFNPPHFGHVAAWEDMSKKFPHWFVGTNKSTQGPKDPLPFKIKIQAMETFMPSVREHLVAEQNWWSLATLAYSKYGESVTLHIVTDEKDAKIFVPGIKKYNGVQGAHGYYKFKDVVWHKAVRASEASKVRKAVVDNNPEAFSAAAGVPAETLFA